MSVNRKNAIVAIIGGGFSGAALAVHLHRAVGGLGGVGIVVFEPRERLGAGLAYSTPEPANRINVPAGRMTLYPDDPDSFIRYLDSTNTLTEDAAAVLADGQAYPQRKVFGAYVAAEIAPLLDAGTLQHKRSKVVHVARHGDGWELHTADGDSYFADIVVVATSHPPPALPRALIPLANHPKLVPDVNADAALDDIAAGDRILIVGNGLTAADAFAALKRRGYHGSVVSLSRRGLRSRGHPAVLQEPYGDFADPPLRSASELLRRVREALRAAQASGATWHGVLDAVRLQGRDIWWNLPLSERRRVVRWLRPFWDAHRFRIAPQVETLLDEAVVSGQLRIVAGSLVSAQADEEGSLHVDLRLRGQKNITQIDLDAIIVTTGPAHGGILKSQAFLSGLEDAGLLTLCPTGLGIRCDERSRAIDSLGKSVETLLIGGPLARGTFGELMGLPQVTEHAVYVAGEIAHSLASAAVERHGSLKPLESTSGR
ncbi:FAD/NAD(P)-binding protein [Agrobacterium tumefaciens]|uniref:FAD/NAD(P)-binding protein n=1 Tax=Agrobacterium tumefaciens TaxID=358 RepID=UPI0015725052|nr:FAD/NAD(P)-binding protein [Agrobacterium tumefaciens]WCK05082.1 FAD/NAD(P)-binding protein [Agrobacterium tumefaciens]